MAKLISLFAALLIALSGCGGGGGARSGGDPGRLDPAIRVDAGTSAGISMTMGAQVDDFVAFDQIDAQARLNALGVDLFRIHAGADSAVLPEPGVVDGGGRWDFSALDRLVEIAYDAGAQPILNVRHAPVSLSTCASFHSGAGSLTDPSFDEFATYMANLVAYYNLGGFTDASGTHLNPFGASHRVTYWELWNEPDLPYEFPCLKGPGEPSLTTAEFAAMWTAATQKMRAVDPSIQLLGPTVSDPRNMSYWNAIAGTPNPPDILSMHGYAGPNSAQDSELYGGGGDAIGIAGITAGVANAIAALQSSGRTDTPVFLDEYNVSPDGFDDPFARGWNNYSTALGGALFIRLAKLSASHPIGFIPFQFVEAGGKRLTALDPATGLPLLPYWRDMLLRQAVQAGDTALGVAPTSSGIDVLAARRADGSKITVLIANSRATAGGVGNVGESLSLSLDFAGLSGQKPRSINLRVIDASTEADVGPPVLALDPLQNPVVHFNGFGLALVELVY